MAGTTGLEPATSAVTVLRSKPTELRSLNLKKTALFLKKLANYIKNSKESKYFFEIYRYPVNTSEIKDISCLHFLYNAKKKSL